MSHDDCENPVISKWSFILYGMSSLLQLTFQSHFESNLICSSEEFRLSVTAISKLLIRLISLQIASSNFEATHAIILLQVVILLVQVVPIFPFVSSPSLKMNLKHSCIYFPLALCSHLAQDLNIFFSLLSFLSSWGMPLLAVYSVNLFSISCWFTHTKKGRKANINILDDP